MEEKTANGKKVHLIVNGVKYLVILGYIVCLILTLNYGIQSNVTTQNLYDTLVANNGEYSEEYYNSLKKNTQGMVTTVGVSVLFIALCACACACVLLWKSNRLLRIVLLGGTLIVMFIFTVAFLGLVGAANKHLTSLYTSYGPDPGELIKSAHQEVSTNVQAVAITSALGLLFTLLLIAGFVYNNFFVREIHEASGESEQSSEIEMTNLSTSDLKTTGVHI